MISAVVHTYNEEKNIERCLTSLNWVDEIILIDMGSTDKTTEIARRFKVKIFKHSFTGFVEPARNFGIKHARGNWILIVDADEEIPISLAKFLTIEADNNSGEYYRIARKNIIFGKWIRHAGWWPDYQVRFFQKRAVSWTENIHGIPITRGQGIDVEINPDLSIIHYHYQNLEQYLERLNRYTTITAKELFLQNRKFQPALLFEKPTAEFINRYFVWEGYKEGVYGLALSLLQSLSELLVYLKLWELEGFSQSKINIAEIERLEAKSEKMKKYWYADTRLRQQNNLLEEAFLRLKRKIASYV